VEGKEVHSGVFQWKEYTRLFHKKETGTDSFLRAAEIPRGSQISMEGRACGTEDRV